MNSTNPLEKEPEPHVYTEFDRSFLSYSPEYLRRFKPTVVASHIFTGIRTYDYATENAYYQLRKKRGLVGNFWDGLWEYYRRVLDEVPDPKMAARIVWQDMVNHDADPKFCGAAAVYFWVSKDPRYKEIAEHIEKLRTFYESVPVFKPFARIHSFINGLHGLPHWINDTFGYMYNLDHSYLDDYSRGYAVGRIITENVEWIEEKHPHPLEYLIQEFKKDIDLDEIIQNNENNPTPVVIDLPNLLYMMSVTADRIALEYDNPERAKQFFAALLYRIKRDLMNPSTDFDDGVLNGMMDYEAVYKTTSDLALGLGIPTIGAASLAIIAGEMGICHWLTFGATLVEGGGMAMLYVNKDSLVWDLIESLNPELAIQNLQGRVLNAAMPGFAKRLLGGLYYFMYKLSKHWVDKRLPNEPEDKRQEMAMRMAAILSVASLQIGLKGLGKMLKRFQSGRIHLELSPKINPATVKNLENMLEHIRGFTTGSGLEPSEKFIIFDLMDNVIDRLERYVRNPSQNSVIARISEEDVAAIKRVLESTRDVYEKETFLINVLTWMRVGTENGSEVIFKEAEIPKSIKELVNNPEIFEDPFYVQRQIAQTDVIKAELFSTYSVKELSQQGVVEISEEEEGITTMFLKHERLIQQAVEYDRILARNNAINQAVTMSLAKEEINPHLLMTNARIIDLIAKGATVDEIFQKTDAAFYYKPWELENVIRTAEKIKQKNPQLFAQIYSNTHELLTKPEVISEKADIIRRSMVTLSLRSKLQYTVRFRGVNYFEMGIERMYGVPVEAKISEPVVRYIKQGWAISAIEISSNINFRTKGFLVYRVMDLNGRRVVFVDDIELHQDAWQFFDARDVMDYLKTIANQSDAQAIVFRASIFDSPYLPNHGILKQLETSMKNTRQTISIPIHEYEELFPPAQYTSKLNYYATKYKRSVEDIPNRINAIEEEIYVVPAK